MTDTQTERTRAVIDKLYDAYLTGSTEGMLALMAPDVKVTFNYAGTFTGMAEARPFMTWNGAQPPELQFNVRHKIIDGNHAAVTWDETGKTIRGDDWSSIGVDVYHIEGDQIVEMTCYADTEKVARLLDPYPGPQ
jgi:ketosteroid isomerase-like protein